MKMDLEEEPLLDENEENFELIVNISHVFQSKKSFKQCLAKTFKTTSFNH